MRVGVAVANVADDLPFSFTRALVFPFSALLLMSTLPVLRFSGVELVNSTVTSRLPLPAIVLVPPPEVMVKLKAEPEPRVAVTVNESVPRFLILKLLLCVSLLAFFLMWKLKDLSETESLLDELLSGSKDDCADAERANAGNEQMDQDALKTFNTTQQARLAE
jgi:hypothetical protein